MNNGFCGCFGATSILSLEYLVCQGQNNQFNLFTVNRNFIFYFLLGWLQIRKNSTLLLLKHFLIPPWYYYKIFSFNPIALYGHSVICFIHEVHIFFASVINKTHLHVELIRWFPFCKGKYLKWKHEYSFFIRAWFGNNLYKIFKSTGVKILSRPPSTTNIRGVRVKEVIGTSMKDVDYINETTPVRADWTHNFVGDIMKYHVYLSTFPGGVYNVLIFQCTCFLLFRIGFINILC